MIDGCGGLKKDTFAAMLDDWDTTLRSFWRVAPVGEVARIERANQNVIGAAR